MAGTSSKVVLVLENVVSNPYSQNVYNAAASVFPITYHHFILAHSSEPINDEQLVHVDEDVNP